MYLPTAVRQAFLGEALRIWAESRRGISQLVNKRDERRDAFAKGMKLTMNTMLGQDADEIHKVLGKHSVTYPDYAPIFRQISHLGPV